MPKVLNGLGIALVSTSEGVITDKEARKRNVGGRNYRIRLVIKIRRCHNMSRVGKKIIDILSDVTVTFDGNHVTVKGPKGELSRTLNERMTFKQEENTIEVVRPSDSKEDRTNHGTTRASLNNMVQGVSQGYVKVLELVGVGYRAQMQGKDLILNVGYSTQ